MTALLLFICVTGAVLFFLLGAGFKFISSLFARLMDLIGFFIGILLSGCVFAAVISFICGITTAITEGTFLSLIKNALFLILIIGVVVSFLAMPASLIMNIIMGIVGLLCSILKWICGLFVWFAGFCDNIYSFFMNQIVRISENNTVHN